MTEKKIRTPRKTTKIKPVEKTQNIIELNQTLETYAAVAANRKSRFQDEEEMFRQISEQVEKERHR